MKANKTNSSKHSIPKDTSQDVIPRVHYNKYLKYRTQLYRVESFFSNRTQIVDSNYFKIVGIKPTKEEWRKWIKNKQKKNTKYLRK